MSLFPGCKVRLISSGEVGVVIHSFVNEELATIITNTVFTFTKEKDEKGMAAWAEKCKKI